MSTTVVIVTGASRGIGKGIALACSKAGPSWITYITGRQLDTLQASCDDIIKQSGHKNVHPLVCDHKNDQQTKQVLEKVYTAHGKIDVLVNNAYGAVEDIMSADASTPPPFWEKPLEIWDASHVVGLRSHYVASVIVSKFMVKAKKGLIVNVSSAGGLFPIFDVAYGVGKAALDRLTADTALALLPFNVTVVSLWPGAVTTESVLSHIINNPKANPKAKAMFADAETTEFSGKAVVALAKDKQAIRFTGKIVQTTELAQYYDFVDADGKLHGLAFGKEVRNQLKKTPKHWETPNFSKL